MNPDPAPVPCPQCGLDPQSSLACLHCSRLLEEAPGATHFQRLGLPVGVVPDAAALERSYLRLSRLLHPDFHGASDESLRDLALRHSALLNEAYVTLGDPESRAEYLLGLHDPQALDRWKQLASEFLMTAMETSEAVEQAGLSHDGDALARLRREARAEIDARLASLADPAAWTAPDTRRLATLLHELRVFRRILRDAERAA
ncbi:MAG TPA: Fe-S protein assembly co-chaperone HscB [Planctomycetota bacterium]|nr:Fe-S protein assembly co-chaperone HscB [Planctomycetota bacterium]